MKYAGDVGELQEREDSRLHWALMDVLTKRHWSKAYAECKS